jgi:hypothetical protein
MCHSYQTFFIIATCAFRKIKSRNDVRRLTIKYKLYFLNCCYDSLLRKNICPVFIQTV